MVGNMRKEEMKVENIESKGTDRLCKVVELSMQCCGQVL